MEDDRLPQAFADRDSQDYFLGRRPIDNSMICAEAADSNALLPSVDRIEQEETKIYELKVRWHISACSGAFQGDPSLYHPIILYPSGFGGAKPHHIIIYDIYVTIQSNLSMDTP